MALSFRRARAEDLDRLVTIHAFAYPDGRRYDARVRHFRANPLGTLDDLWVAETTDAAIVGHAFLFALEAWFGGERVPVGGVSSVAVAPEVRGSGVASRLLAHLHDVARSRGDVLTVLYPFRQDFYGRVGYAATSPYRHLRFSPAALCWTPEQRIRQAAGRDREGMAACWEAAGVLRTGMLARSARAWEARLLDERLTWFVVDGEHGVDGHVAWAIHQPEPHGETTLLVYEMAARSAAAARSLWAAVAAQRDQVTRVEVDVADDDPLDRALVDADRGRPGNVLVPHSIGELTLGPMIRVVDLVSALQARGWRGAGRIVIDAGEGSLEITVRDGRASVALTNTEPALRMDRVALAAVAFGGLRPSHASRLGWLAARDDRALTHADALFALPAYFSQDRF